MLEQRTQSVMKQLGKDLTDRMKDEGDLYWLNIQLDMMSMMNIGNQNQRIITYTISLFTEMSVNDYTTILLISFR